MSSEAKTPTRARRALAPIGWLALGATLATFTFYILLAGDHPDLQPWHRVKLESEFRAGDDDIRTLEDYLELEERLFDELQRALAKGEESAGPFSRFHPESPTNPHHFEPNYNRTFELTPPRIQGGALLLHGLTDTPYSVRSTAEILERQGYYCLALRIPGHGTAPGSLTKATWRDWRAAVALAVRAVEQRLEPSQPLILVGYSNGAALALDHVLGALESEAEPVADKLVFLSPAFAVSRLAALARWQGAMSHLPGLHKLAWNSVLEEHDPYKYNSFALNGGRQIHELTSGVERRLQRLVEANRAADLPQILTIQSVVDATVPPVASLNRLYSRLEETGSELVLFDVNRASESQAFLRGSVDALLRQATPGEPHPFDVTLVTNRDESSRQLHALTRKAGSRARTSEALELEWPQGVYSLSHVAIPFPPDDPVYGRTRSSFPFPFGRLEPRGERGALILPMDLLMRLRFNPFFSYQERRIVEFVTP